MTSLTNKVAVVTGAASGIGRAIVLNLVRQQARVVAIDIDQTALDTLAKEQQKFGVDLATYAFDLSDAAMLAQHFKSICDRFGHLDYWFNIAGVQGNGSFLSTPQEAFERVISTNFLSLTRCTRLALEHMDAKGSGMIINMGSVAGLVPAPLMTSYVASKHAVVGFTRALQAELDLLGSSVGLLLVNPGFAATKIVSKGEHLGFPNWLSWMLARPETVAAEIITAVMERRREITPTLSGKLMKAGFRHLPATTVKSSRLLLTRNLKDVVLRRYHL